MIHKNQSNHSIKAILFDMGNVLLFFNARISSKAFAEATGLAEGDIWELFFISELEKSYTRGELSSKDFYEQVCPYFPKKINYETFSRLWNDIFTENSEMDELLKSLKKHYPLYMISNTNDLHFEYIKKNFNITKHFTGFFPSHEVGHRKPNPAMFQHVLKEIKLKPDEAVFIDDILEFVESARKLGINAVQFTSRKKLEQDLRNLGIQYES